MTEESAVKVCVRVRPFIKRELSASENAEPVPIYWKADGQAIHQIDDGNGNLSKSFTFDRVFSAEESTSQLYQDIAKSLVVSAVEGYNGTIFAYGQTSSGKTFTMMGNHLTPGVIPLAMEDVFKTIANCPKKEFLLRVSYMEIYNETVTDLLCDSWKRKPLEVREGNYKNVYVADLTEELVTSPEQALAWISKGEKNRHYGKTKMNERSSRSHTIFRMIIESRERSDPASGEISDGAIIVSHLNLVDLAGAERASQTGAEGTRFKEGCNINRSLFTLGQVIKKLTDENQKGFTNYRDSKLTRILQNSLGGNAKTVIICTITPAAQDETLSTLQFASAAKRMKNDPHVTEVSDDGALLRRYRNEINELKQRLQEVSSVTKTTVTEKQTLCQLLQEKEQLQRDQEDRIRNLTKLLVTASNVVPVKRAPKRRMTWAGLRAADGDGDTQLLGPLVKQRCADLSSISEQDDLDSFDGRWESPSDRLFDQSMDQSTVTQRKSSFTSPAELSDLEEQREKESQLRQEVQLQLEKELQEKRELQLQLEKEMQEKVELRLQLEKGAEEKKDCLTLLEKEVQEKRDLSAQLEKEVQEKQELNTQLEKEAQEKQDLHTQLEKEAQEKQDLHTQLEKEAQEKQDLHTRLEKEAQEKQDLHTQLEKEAQEKQDLHTQLEKEAQEKQDLHTQLEMEALEKQDLHTQLEEDAREKQDLYLQLQVERMELEKHAGLASQQQNNPSSFDSEQLHKTLGESIQLCETLTAEKTNLEAEKQNLEAEQEQLKEKLQQYKEEVERLKWEAEKLVEEREEDEFELLEREMKKESEEELQAEIANWKRSAEDSNVQVQQLKAELEVLSDLQGDKDLVQEVKRLRRSLEDAEGLSRDTKKEWAFLRSENLALKERDGVLTAEHQHMKSELDSVQTQLELEKKRFKKMQLDLQKELMGAFDENTKLTTLLDGKVPKNLVDGVILERSVAELKKELEQRTLCEGELRSQLELLRRQEGELQSELQQKVDGLTHQVCELTDQLCEAQSKRDELLVIQQEQQQELQTAQEEQERLQEATQTAQEEQERLQQELQTAQEEQEKLQQELQVAQEEQERLQEATQTAQEQQERLQQELQTAQEEQERLQEATQEKLRAAEGLLQEALRQAQEQQGDALAQAQEQQRQYEEAIQTNQEISMQKLEDSQKRLETLEQELKETKGHRELLQEELQKTQEHLLQTGELFQQEMQTLREKHQQELQTACEHQQEDFQNAKQLLEEDLQKARDEQEKLQLELQRAQERLLDDQASLEPGVCPEELERLHSDLRAVTAQKTELEEILEGVREEKNQLKRDLEESVDMCVQTQSELMELQSRLPDNSCAADQKTIPAETTAELERLRSEVASLSAALKQKESQKEDDQHSVREQLQMELQKAQEQHEAESQRAQELHDELIEELQKVQEQRDSLQQELTQAQERQQRQEAECQRAREQQVQLMQELQKAQEERESLQLELTQAQECQPDQQAEFYRAQEQREQLKQELQKAQEKQESLQQELTQAQEHQQHQQAEFQGAQEQREQLMQELQKAEEKQKSLQQELNQAQERQQQQEAELQRARDQRDELAEELQRAQERLLNDQASLEPGVCPEELERLRYDLHTVTAQKTELEEILEGVREEKNQLKRDLEESVDMCVQTQSELMELQSRLQDHSKTPDQKTIPAETTAELERLHSEVASLSAALTQKESQNEDNQHSVREQLQMELQKAEDSHQQEMLEVQEQQHCLKEELEKAGELLQQATQAAQEEQERLQQELQTAQEEQERLQEATQTAQEERERLQQELQVAEKRYEMSQRQLYETRELQEQREEELCRSQALQEQLKQELHNAHGRQEALEQQLQEQPQQEDHQELLQQAQEQLQHELQMAKEQHQRQLLEAQQQKCRIEEELNGALEQQLSLEADLQKARERQEQLQLELQGALQHHSQNMQDAQEQHKRTEEDLRQKGESLQQALQTAQEQQRELEEQLRKNEDSLKQEVQRGQDEQEKLLEEMLRLRERLQHHDFEASGASEELQRLQSELSTQLADRKELQEMLDGLREEKQQLKARLEENMDMAQEQLQQLEELKRDKNQMQIDLQNSTDKASGLEAQLHSSTVEKQDLLERVQCLTEQQKEAAEERRQEVRRLTGCLGALRVQEAELKQQLQEYQEDRRSRHRRETQEDYAELVQRDKDCQQKLEDWCAQVQRLAEQMLTRRLQGWTAGLLACSLQREKDLYEPLLPRMPCLEREVSHLEISNQHLQGLLTDHLASLQKLCAGYKQHFEGLWTQEAQDVLHSSLLERRERCIQEMAGVAQQMEKKVEELEKLMDDELKHRQRRNNCLRDLIANTPADSNAVLMHIKQGVNHRIKLAKHIWPAGQALHKELKELESLASRSKVPSGEEQCSIKATPASPAQAHSSQHTLLQEDNRQLRSRLEEALGHTQVLEQELKDLQAAHETSSQQCKKQQLQLKELQDSLARTRVLEKELKDLQAAHETSSQQCTQQQLQLKELQDSLAHTQKLAESRMTPTAQEMQRMKDRLVNMELQSAKLSASHQKEVERMTSVLKHKEELIRKLKEELRMKHQDVEGSYVEDGHATHAGQQAETQQLQKKIAGLESSLTNQQEEVEKWRRRAYKLKANRRYAGLHTPTRNSQRSPSPDSHTTPTKCAHPPSPTRPKQVQDHGQAQPSPGKRAPLAGSPHHLNSPQRAHKNLFFDLPPVAQAPGLTRSRGFFDMPTPGTATVNANGVGGDDDPLASEGGGAKTAMKDLWPKSPKQESKCDTQ